MPSRHPGKQFQQVTANGPRRAGGSGPLVGQIIREPDISRPSGRAATGNGTIEHGEAPASEGL